MKDVRRHQFFEIFDPRSLLLQNRCFLSKILFWQPPSPLMDDVFMNGPKDEKGYQYVLKCKLMERNLANNRR